ncbi:hypothetical protein JW707_00950 [Candidatus Woesearchaeota archaeon]|nr:hypothetical protein [Candidatus Woesearchaeota archaeon]
MTETVSEGMLEDIMSRCTPKKRVVIKSGGGVQYVAFRRKGYVNAVAVSPDVRLNAKQFHRVDLDTVIERIGKENILGSRQVFSDGPVCIAQYSFERYKEYEIPKGATLVRRGNNRMRFFTGAVDQPAYINGRKNKFKAVPERATHVRADGVGYEWFLPGRNGKYDWKRESELHGKKQ